MVIMPWTEEFFRPWTGYRSPFLCVLPDEMQKYLGYLFSEMENLPQF